MMKTVNVAGLEGVALDWAVAQAVEAWKMAHELFPTWTMDATFSGVRPMVYSDGQAFCQLIPNNPMRQDPQRYSPSTDWSQGGPLLQPNQVVFRHHGDGKIEAACMAGEIGVNRKRAKTMKGPDYLIAACRAIVAAKFGDTVEVPEELL